MLETAFLYTVALGLLCAHLATLRLLYSCRRHATDFTEQMAGEGAFMSGRMEEVCRIGSDIADTLEAIIDSGSLASAASSTVAGEELDLKATIASLLLSKVMGSNDGSTPQQEGSIYGKNETKNQSASTQDDNETQE